MDPDSLLNLLLGLSGTQRRFALIEFRARPVEILGTVSDAECSEVVKRLCDQGRNSQLHLAIMRTLLIDAMVQEYDAL